LGNHIPLLFVNYLSGEEGSPVRAGTPVSDKEDKYLARKLSLPEAHEQGIVKQGKYPGVRTKNYYHVHDWMVSRQKKWGTPLPLIDCDRCGFVPVPTEKLPITVGPHGNDGNTRPDVICPACQKLAKHATDTLDCYIDDVWCFLSSELHFKENFRLAQAGRYGWFPADQYHAGYDIHMYLHLYRFVSRFLYERGYLDTPEPISVHIGHDMVLQGNRKMSKRHRNAIGVRALVDVHGADVVRLAIILAANPDRPIRWREEYVSRARRQVRKVLEMASMLAQMDRNANGEPILPELRKRSLEKKCRNLIKTVTKHIASYRPGSGIQYLEKYTKDLYEVIRPLTKGQMNGDDFHFVRNYFLKLCVISSPFMPHIAEEAWEQLAGEGFAAQAEWPNDEPLPG
jgi:leucyl-tRNA synthetase